MAQGDVSLGRLLIIEYERIKDEQKSRIAFRDNLLYAVLGSMVAVVAATLNVHSRADLLLLLPPVSLLLGWTYLVNDEKISAIGRYIRTELGPRLTAMLENEPTVFGWESAHRTDERRASRKLLQLAVDLTTFCVSPWTAIIVYWVNGPLALPFLSVSIAEAVAIAGLTIQIARYADVRS